MSRGSSSISPTQDAVVCAVPLAASLLQPFQHLGDDLEVFGPRGLCSLLSLLIGYAGMRARYRAWRTIGKLDDLEKFPELT